VSGGGPPSPASHPRLGEAESARHQKGRGTMTEFSTLVPYRITICGIAELSCHADAGVTHVLTILDPDHPDPPVFAAYGPHRRLVWRFHDTIRERPDLAHPTAQTVRAILDFGAGARDMDIDHLLIHCHMGISRSTACAAILMAQHRPDRERDAFEHLWEIRPRSWPNSRMIALADAMLGRNGALFTAMQEHHARVAQAFPDFAAELRLGERAHEVPEGRP
jgi:predicted protein tyrosine phosphatase